MVFIKRKQVINVMNKLCYAGNIQLINLNVTNVRLSDIYCLQEEMVSWMRALMPGYMDHCTLDEQQGQQVCMIDLSTFDVCCYKSSFSCHLDHSF